MRGGGPGVCVLFWSSLSSTVTNTRYDTICRRVLFEVGAEGEKSMASGLSEGGNFPSFKLRLLPLATVLLSFSFLPFLDSFLFFLKLPSLPPNSPSPISLTMPVQNFAPPLIDGRASESSRSSLLVRSLFFFFF